MRNPTREESQIESALTTTSSSNIEELPDCDKPIVSPAQQSADGKSIEIPVGKRNLVIGCWPLGVVGLFILALVFMTQILVPALAAPTAASGLLGNVFERLGDLFDWATAWIPP